MNDLKLADITTKCFILALFVRDDGERFLLGTGAYEFKQSQQHFAANSMSNDVVSVQGNDGYLLAGQVRRPNPQVFDGYIGDASVIKSQVEGMRRNFFEFFQKNHFYTVIYIFPDGSAIQRRRGFIVDSPEVKELYQVFPEYHVALNFEDTNYYKYAETPDGEEAYTKSANVGLSTVATGGLVWAGIETVILTGEGTSFNLSGTIDGEVLQEVLIKGDTSQTTYSGKNLLANLADLVTNEGITGTLQPDGSVKYTGTSTASWGFNLAAVVDNPLNAGTYTLSIDKTVDVPIKVGFRDSGGTAFQTVTIEAGQTSATITLSQAPVKTTLWSNAPQGTTVDFTVKLMLESGSSATSFEPYVGSTASPNPDYPQEVQTVTGGQVIDIHGKNLLNLSGVSGTSNGVNFSVNNGKLVLDGSCNSDRVIILIPALKLSGTYTFSTDWNSNSAIALRRSSTSTLLQIPSSGTYISGEIDGTANYIYIFGLSGTSFNNLEIAFQLEKGSTATDFVPYESQEYEINLGGEQFNKNNVYNGHYVQQNGTMVADASWCMTDYMAVDAGRAYNYSGITLAGNAPYSAYYDKNKTLVSTFKQATGSNTITIPDGVAYVRFSLRDISPNVDKDTFSFSLDGVNIELCKIGDYQDYIYRQNGEWYLHKETGRLTFDGSETWSSASAYTGYMRASVATGENHASNEGYCNEFINRGSQAHGGYEYMWVQPNANTFYIQILQSRANSLDAFKTWLASNPATVYYVLATPTDTQITNEALLEQLEALAEATTYDRLTIFSVTSENLPATLAASVEATTQGGVEWDEYGAVFEEGSTGGATTIAVDSITEVLPVWTVKGPANNPTIQNLTTGTSMSFIGNVTASQTLKVDMLNQTATLNGTSVIGRMSGDWIELAPGNNRMYYSTGNSDAPDSSLEWQEVVG